MQADADFVRAGKALEEQKLEASALAAENSELKAQLQLLHKRHQEAARKACDAGTLAEEQMQALEEDKVQPEVALTPVSPLFIWLQLSSSSQLTRCFTF